MRVIRRVFINGDAFDRAQALRAVNAELGNQRLGPRLHGEIDGAIRIAVRRGILDNSNGELRLLARSLEDYDRNFLKKQFLAAMGRGWVEREEAIRMLSRWMGYSRTTEGMMAVGKSLINGLIREGMLEVEGRERVRRTK